MRTAVDKRWEANLNVLLHFANMLETQKLQPVWHKLAKAKIGKERLILQNTCQATVVRLKLDCPVIPADFCQNLLDLTVPYTDLLSLLHGLSI